MFVQFLLWCLLCTSLPCTAMQKFKNVSYQPISQENNDSPITQPPSDKLRLLEVFKNKHIWENKKRAAQEQEEKDNKTCANRILDCYRNFDKQTLIHNDYCTNQRTEIFNACPNLTTLFHPKNFSKHPFLDEQKLTLLLKELEQGYGIVKFAEYSSNSLSTKLANFVELHGKSNLGYLERYHGKFYQKHERKTFDYPQNNDCEFFEQLSKIIDMSSEIVEDIVVQDVKTSDYAHYLLLHPNNEAITQKDSRFGICHGNRKFSYLTVNDVTTLLASLRTLQQQCIEQQIRKEQEEQVRLKQQQQRIQYEQFKTALKHYCKQCLPCLPLPT